MTIGIWKLFLILLIVFVLFGAGKLPTVMGDLGKGVRNLKAGLKGLDLDSDEDEEEAPKKVAKKSTAVKKVAATGEKKKSTAKKKKAA